VHVRTSWLHTARDRHCNHFSLCALHILLGFTCSEFFSSLSLDAVKRATVSSALLCLVSVLVVGDNVLGNVRPSRSPAFLRLLESVFHNHSYVDFNLVGRTFYEALVCQASVETCCQENHTGTGDWYFPSGERLSNDSELSDIYMNRSNTSVALHRQNGATTAGMYRCEIETSRENGNSRETLYAGLYSSGG